MKSYTYYLPFQSIRLSQYFGSACISPTQYENDQTSDDQSIYQRHLLLSRFCGSQSSNCCIEVVLSESEHASLFPLDNNGNLYLLNKPLPISRVRKIYFRNEQQKQQTISSIILSTAFIPEQMIETKKFPSFEIPVIKEVPNSSDWTDKIRQFDKLLGGFTIMKLCENKYCGFSDNYFSTLSYFNPKIASELKKQNIEIYDQYFDVFEGKNYFKNLTPYLRSKIDENTLKQIAFLDNKQEISYKGSAILRLDVERLNNIAYIAAILYEYGTGNEIRHDKIDSLIFSKFKKGIKPNMAEIIALAYGMNRGYTIFPNKYKTNTENIKVKFTLESQLDYYTIESLYQNSINRNNISNDFYYLDWCPTKSNNHNNNYAFKILDIEILNNEEKNKPFSIASLLQNCPTEWRSILEPIFSKVYSIIQNNIQEEKNGLIEEKEKIINDLKEEIKILKQSNTYSSQFTDNEREDIINNILDLSEIKSEELNRMAKKYGYKGKGSKKRDKIMHIFKSQQSNLKFKK